MSAMSVDYESLYDVSDAQLWAMMKSNFDQTACRHNVGVMCKQKAYGKCRSCGWNPSVAYARSKTIRREMRKKNESN